ncbi:MAG TPA: GntR family transcriptional regulator [Candidatus Baltobacteraceae bacterium]|nr:GntR family transcriptional regulator [Candidatus Baltobacteraceae bacterium]
MTNKTFERASTAVRVATVLRERIANGELRPGSRLIELDISRELGVSRSPVREALLRLAEEGLVEILPYRGAMVVPLDKARLTELLEFRLALERFALERLVARSDPAAIARLRKRVDALDAAIARGDRQASIDADLAIHRELIALAGNRLVERAFESLIVQIRLYIDVTSAQYERAEDLATEHEAFLTAVERGETIMSRKLLDAHIMHGFEDLTP